MEITKTANSWKITFGPTLTFLTFMLVVYFLTSSNFNNAFLEMMVAIQLMRIANALCVANSQEKA